VKNKHECITWTGGRVSSVDTIGDWGQYTSLSINQTLSASTCINSWNAALLACSCIQTTHGKHSCLISFSELYILIMHRVLEAMVFCLCHVNLNILIIDTGRRAMFCTANQRETAFLYQRISVAIQRFNAACLTDMFTVSKSPS